MIPAPDLDRAITMVAREDRGRILAALVAQFRDFDLAEEALQDALASAHIHWGRVGLPHDPRAWLIRAASRKAIDQLRKGVRARRYIREVVPLAEHGMAEPEDIPDHRLRLIFTCCHPALEQKTQVALTLRTIAGLSTGEIARAFLDKDSAMGQRLSRAKAKISAAGIPFVVPGPEMWAERLGSVLAVIYLIFNQGYTAGEGENGPRRGLCAEAIFLARMVDNLRPDEAEIEGLLALLLLTHARRRARVAGGQMVPVEAQDATLWDKGMIAEGQAVLERAMARGQGGPYQVKAAISALHLAGAPTDWPQIYLLYDTLIRYEPTPVVALNRAVAQAEAGQGAAALHALAGLAGALDDYQPYHAARADLLARQGAQPAAKAAYKRAIELSDNVADIAFLRSRLAGLR